MSSVDGIDGYSATGSLHSQPSGTLSSLLRKSLHWPLHVGRSLTGTPRWLARRMHGAARAVGIHLRERQEDYVFFYELLSLGFPLLFMLYEITGQMSLEESSQIPL